MNRPEAYKIIAAALEQYHGLGFIALSGRIGTKATEDVVAPSGVRYTLDVSFDWTDSQHRSVVVQGRIDDQNTFHSVPLEEKIYVSNAA
ncbi:MAG: hypothetical protein JF609_09695 [Verrucomicrobia bacterium]|nr:hypothetical protein [Verrucomicrobiota bacterium]